MYVLHRTFGLIWQKVIYISIPLVARVKRRAASIHRTSERAHSRKPALIHPHTYKVPERRQAVSRALVPPWLIYEQPASLHERGYAYGDHSSLRPSSGYWGLPGCSRRAGVGPAPGPCPKAPGAQRRRWLPLRRRRRRVRCVVGTLGHRCMGAISEG